MMREGKQRKDGTDSSDAAGGPSMSAPATLSMPLRRPEQSLIAAVILASLLAMVGYWLWHGGHRGGLIDIDQAEPLTARFLVDINQAPWPELMQLPGIGETLARRIVRSREQAGRFERHEDLQRIHGLGPKLLDRIRPYLAPLEAAPE